MAKPPGFGKPGVSRDIPCPDAYQSQDMPRPRRIIVDAFNVLHVTGVLDRDHAGPDIEDLAGLIAASRWAGVPTTLACDGPGSGAAKFRPPAGVSVVFAGAGRDADSLIEEMIGGDSAPRSLRVVSSDRRLQRAARKRRAGWISSEDFLRGLNHDAQRSGTRIGASAPGPAVPLPDEAVARWLERFGVGDGHPLRRLRAAAGRDEPIAEEFGRRDAAGTGNRSPQRGPAAEPTDADPVLRQAFDEWRDRLHPDDLDMRRWIAGVEPTRRPEEPPASLR